MQIRSTKLAQPVYRKNPSPSKQESVGLVDNLYQRGAGAAATGLSSAIGWAGASIGEAVGGLPGRVIGGAVATAGVALATKFGMNKIPGQDADVINRVATRTAFITGASAALGAAGGGLGALAGTAAGALFSGRILDSAEAIMAHAPRHRSSDAPEGMKDVTITTSDGIELQAWLTEGKEDAPVAIFFHSNGTNIEDNIERIQQLEEAGVRVLAPEYRGYGGSEGIPTERGLKKDARAAYDFAATLVEPEKIILAGQSLGGGVASTLATEKPHGAVILEATFDSFAGASEYLMGDWAGRLTRGRYPNINNVAKLDTPIFVGHGGWDDMVGPEAGDKLASNAKNATYLFEPRAGHMDVNFAESYDQALKGFLKDNGFTEGASQG